MESHGGIGSTEASIGAESLAVAQLDVHLHYPEAGALRLQTTPIDAKNLPDVAAGAMDRALLAEETVDLKAAANE